MPWKSLELLMLLCLRLYSFRNCLLRFSITDTQRGRCCIWCRVHTSRISIFPSQPKCLVELWANMYNLMFAIYEIRMFLYC